MTLRSIPLDLSAGDLARAHAGTYLFDLVCPHCGEENKKLIRDLVANDDLPCSYCGVGIDITSDEARSSISQRVKALAQVEFGQKR